MLSMHDSREYISSSVMHGAAGYILKDVSTDEIVSAIETVAGGGTYFSSGVFDVLMERGRARSEADPLTPRERDILGLIVAGRSNRGDRRSARHHRRHGRDASQEPQEEARHRHDSGPYPLCARSRHRVKAADRVYPLLGSPGHFTTPPSCEGRNLRHRTSRGWPKAGRWEEFKCDTSASDQSENPIATTRAKLVAAAG